MQNPYVAAAARRLLGIAVPFTPVQTHAKDGKGRDEEEAAKEAKAIGIANGGRAKLNNNRTN